jgi:hypothetical protein
MAENEKETCPKCGAERCGPVECGYQHWLCESFAHATGLCLEQSQLCKCRTRLSAAERENERLRAVAEAARKYRADERTVGWDYSEADELDSALAALTPQSEGGGV